MLLGLSPNQLALANTVLATVIAGGLGVLAASITQLDSTSLPLQVVPALTAALFARFTSFWIAATVGLAIGMLENILYYLQTLSWFPTDNGVALPGVQPLLVFGLMVVAMFVRGTNLPTRGELVEQRLPLAPRAEQLWRTASISTTVAVVLADRAALRLPAGADHVAAGDDHVPLARRDHRLRRSDLGRPARARRHLGLHRLAPRGTITASASRWAMLIGAVRRDRVRARRRGLRAARPRRQPRRRHARRRRGDRAVRLPATRPGAAAASSSPVPEPEIFGLDLGPYASFRGLDGNVPSPVFGFFVLGVHGRCSACSSRTSAAPTSDSGCSPSAPTSARRPRPASTSATSSSPRSRSARSSPGSAARSTATTSARSPSAASRH